MADLSAQDLAELTCTTHALERWHERADEAAHPNHDHNAVVRYVQTQTRQIPTDLAVALLRTRVPGIDRSYANKQHHRWDRGFLLFAITPAGTPPEQYPCAGIQTLIRLDDEQERKLEAALANIEARS